MLLAHITYDINASLCAQVSCVFSRIPNIFLLRHIGSLVNLHTQLWFLWTKQGIIIKFTNVCTVYQGNVSNGIQKRKVQVIIVTICEFDCPERFFHTKTPAFEVPIDQEYDHKQADCTKGATTSNNDFLFCWKSWNKTWH